MKVYVQKTVGWICVILFVSVISNLGYGQTHDQPYMETALKQLELSLGVKIGKAAHLNKAKLSLESATSDKGGHRKAAISKINQALEILKLHDFVGADTFTREAIIEVKAGIAYSDLNPNDTPAVIVKTGQPYMELGLQNLELALGAHIVAEKLTHLEKAKNNLHLATSDKGGHRVAAINKIDLASIKLNHHHPIEANALIREAIAHVKLGIEVGAEK